MPVEERLRSTLAHQADTVRGDVEGPLAQVHRRRGRATAWKAAAAAAAVVAVVAGTSAVLEARPERPAPGGPPTEPTGAPAQPIPFGTYVRPLTADEARDAGFPREEVRHLFGGAEQVLVRMVFREKRDPQTGLNGWVVRFVDEDGQRRIRDGGGYFYDDGELTIVSKWLGCLGCNYHFTYEIDHGRLSLETTPETQPHGMTELLGDGTWERQGG